MATKRKIKALPQPKAKAKPKPKLTDHQILVEVDKKGQFSYTLKGGGDASSLITRRKGDTIEWSVRFKGKRVPFQVEFGNAGPFGFTNRVIRSAGKHSSAMTVDVPDSFSGNFVMEYRVTIGNGWSDDPDVVPILSDGDNGLVAPSVVTIADNGKGELTVTPPSAVAAVNTPVLWKWSGTPKGDFTLTFDDPPPGWPKETHSTSQQIALIFPVASKAPEPYSIKVDNSTLLGTGKLTVS